MRTLSTGGGGGGTPFFELIIGIVCTLRVSILPFGLILLGKLLNFVKSSISPINARSFEVFGFQVRVSSSLCRLFRELIIYNVNVALCLIHGNFLMLRYEAGLCLYQQKS